jgi:hypothetical protein
MPRPAARPTGPILPPLMSPAGQQPSWKQEVRPAETTPAPQETKPETKPEGETPKE